jgi:hypothetical protein
MCARSAGRPRTALPARVRREGVLQFVEADPDRGPGEPIEVRFRTDEVERTVDVCVLLRGRQAEGWRRRLELEERPERRLPGSGGPSL